MKVLSGGLILWFFFDVCLALIPCGLFAALVSGNLGDGNTIASGWLVVCSLLAFIMLARLFRVGWTSFTNYDLVLGWRILIFFLHFGVLASGLNVTVFVAMLLLGAGVSIGEPG